MTGSLKITTSPPPTKIPKGTTPPAQVLPEGTVQTPRLNKAGKNALIIVTNINSNLAGGPLFELLEASMKLDAKDKESIVGIEERGKGIVVLFCKDAEECLRITEKYKDAKVGDKKISLSAY